METHTTALIDIHRIITLDEIEESVADLLKREGVLNGIPQRPLLQQNPALRERIYHPTDSTGFWALALYLFREKKVLNEGAAPTKDWLFRAFLAGQSIAFQDRDLARHYIDSRDRLFRMRQWRDFNGYVRFKNATVYPFRSQVESVTRETEKLALEIGSPPDEDAAIKAIVRSHYFRYGQIKDIKEDASRLMGTAIVEALNMGLLNQSIREETPILCEVHQARLL